MPRFLLKRWSPDGQILWSYRLVVPHENVPEWSDISIRSIAARTDLYTQILGGQEVDQFERWVKADFEDPAVDVLNKAESGIPLRAADWDTLAMFYAAQNLRTPASLQDSLRRWEVELPEMLDRTLKESGRRLEEAARKGNKIVPASVRHPLARTFRVTVDREAEAPEGKSQVKAEITIGRSLWVAEMEHLLTGVAQRLKRHKWTLVEPADGMAWFTSDHPAVRLNYNDPDDYNFEGGWDNPGTDLFLPLSPRLLLFTQVGRDHPSQIKFTPHQTREIQRLICESAHREIYAARPSTRATWLRPRIVDAPMYKAELEEWERWHPRQSAVERELGEDSLE